MLQYIYLLFIFVTNSWLSESAKILAISPVMSKSHNSIHQAILQELAFKGHEILSISYFKSDTNLTNYREIVIPTGTGFSWVDIINITDTSVYNELSGQLLLAQEIEYNFCSVFLRTDHIQRLLKSDLREFDLLISEIYFTRCHSLLAHKLNVPLVSIWPASMSAGIDNFLGNSFNPAYMPFIFGGHTTKMSFFQRVINSMNYVTTYWFQLYMSDIKLKQLSTDALNIDLPSDTILNKKIALALCNNHHSFIARPLSPKVKNIGGIHIKDPKPIPKDILEFIESAKHGVIFFSFGTTIRASSMPVDKLQIILNVLSKIPQKVLWRVNELNATLPPNVKIGQWFPQRDILEHKNVVAFISHCGLFGTFEAIHTATPILAIPFIYDQFQNANILVEKGVAVHLDFETIGEETLLNAIREITNKQYKHNMLELSKIFKDRSMSPLNEAIYWIEYVIRNKGADHFHLAAADMPLYQYLLIDVIFVIVVSILIVIYIGKNIIRVILSPLKSKVKDKRQ